MSIPVPVIAIAERPLSRSEGKLKAAVKMLSRIGGTKPNSQDAPSRTTISCNFGGQVRGLNYASVAPEICSRREGLTSGVHGYRNSTDVASHNIPKLTCSYTPLPASGGAWPHLRPLTFHFCSGFGPFLAAL